MIALNYNKTFFLKSYAKMTDIEIKDGVEIAFIGYSNSGKSSVINALTNQKKLVRFSKTPGRTQLINFFEVCSDFRMVDLPGYGYAKAPIFIQSKWQKIIYNYLKNRNEIKVFVLIMDIRHPLKKLDQKIIDIALNKKVFILILLNKCDKLKMAQCQKQFKIVYEQLRLFLHSMEILLFSSYKKIGIQKCQLILNNFYNLYITKHQ
ncbi:ribosome biogenesis GTP-binding protein YihA/YsxC [Buchnera aphidicola]|uniref:Probable GTP-binding protein EngB n=1 Tax=Buchnera aphidicola subsp. Uroleucon sonchi TaxID=118118 RepID=A0A6C1FH57_BUCUN|nr:ribosome biogenesis GTP-binding protein YihA/YsxC [Buchnera aphidicola]QIE02122.1 YihA family ribosome biogenesis GTP-binding protein [Buchnera aphidicola (Uroleucon sonchi)]